MDPMRTAARLLILLVLVSVAVSLSGQGNPPPAPLRLVSPDGTRPLATIMSGDTELISFDDLSSSFGVTAKEDAVARAITVTYQGKTIVLSQNQALASIGGRLVSLPAAPVRLNNKWYVPVEFISRALALVYDKPLELRKSSRLVLLGRLRAPRVVVRFDPSGAQARVTMDIAPTTGHQVFQEATRLVVRFDADLLDLTLPTVAAQPLVAGIHQSEVPTAIAIDLGPRFGSFRAADTPMDANGTRVTIDVFATPEQTALTPPVPPGPPQPVNPLPVPTTVKTVVVDPGHGGDEEGAHGAKGTMEKSVTLSLARRLKAALETRLGARVLLTREDDRNIGLDERAAFANNNKADLFISLHVNASLRRNAAGAEVFYLSLDRADEEARRVAESEGIAMPVFGGGNREVDVILWEMAQARHLEQSAALARTLEQQLRNAVPMSPQAIQQAPFRVLVGANMPAVLIEIGYLTNAGQESQLAGGEFQARAAQAMSDAVARFFAGDVPTPPPAQTAPSTPATPAKPVPPAAAPTGARPQ
jgi:N-acetylmuramoyl-L-alanine amidase